MNRLRLKLFELLAENWEGSVAEYHATASAICRLMDLDLTLIEDAYHTEAVANFLRYEKEFNESIIATTQAIVLLLEADSGGRIVRGNRYLTQLINDSDDFPPHVETIFDMVPEVDRGLLAELLESQDSKSQGPVTTQLFDSNKRTRTIRWFSRNMNDSVVIIGENTPKLGSYHLIVGHDVTDVVEAQRRAVQQERLAAIGQTMAGLAHESRNAFQRSQAALENLALDVEDRPESVQLVERIQRANDHLLHLYEEVLQFAKPVRLDVHPCSLEDLVHITCQHICQATGYDAKRFSVSAAENCFPISADPYAVEQILRNLIENAIAVSQQDATVDIVVKPSWQGKDRAMRVEISDRGLGISPEFQERVFEPFFSTRPKGTGLGLPISRRLAEAHGGNLTLVGRDGGGTTAILELPEKSLRPHMLDPESQPDLRRSQSNGS